jgi:hypothetical protein
VSVLDTQAVLDEYAEDEYLQRRMVDFPFPLGHLQMIRAQLASGYARTDIGYLSGNIRMARRVHQIS